MFVPQETKCFNGNEILKGEGSNPFNKKLNSEKLKLEFFIINSVKGSLYSIEAKLYENQLIDFTTEKLPSQSEQYLNFSKFMVCNYFFEKQQSLNISVVKDGTKTNLNIILGYIVGAKNSTVTIKFAQNELLMIKAEKLAKTEDVLNVKFSLKKISGDINHFMKKENKIFYSISDKYNKQIYSSSLINNLGTFEPIQIPICLLQPNYIVDFYTSEYQLLYTLNKSLAQIQKRNSDKNEPPININNSLYLFDNSIITKNFSFIDYINAGVKIALSIGIDFTSSNGNPLIPGTLHSIKGNNRNDYARAIESCGKIVGYYDYDQLFPVYGFGAIINSSQNKTPSMCFNLNMTKDPNIKDINNVLKAYYDCIGYKKVTFSGPALFTPLIKEVVSRINKRDLFEYHILMILTNGEVNDLQQTIDALVEASKLPLSVIIVGIGNNDFSNMNILDGDDIPLISSTGEIRKRDLVQFVPFSKFENDAKKLSMEVLAEIPRQIIEYYQYRNLNPVQIKEILFKKKPEPPKTYFGFDSRPLEKINQSNIQENPNNCPYSFSSNIYGEKKNEGNTILMRVNTQRDRHPNYSKVIGSSSMNPYYESKTINESSNSSSSNSSKRQSYLDLDIHGNRNLSFNSLNKSKNSMNNNNNSLQAKYEGSYHSHFENGSKNYQFDQDGEENVIDLNKLTIHETIVMKKDE